MTQPTDYTFQDYSGIHATGVDDASELDLPLQIEGLEGPDEVTPAPPGVPAGDPTRALPREQAHALAPDAYGVPLEQPGPAVAPTPAGSLAEELAQEFATPAVVPTVTIPIPARPRWALRFRLDWNEARTRDWKRRANDPQAPNGISWTKLYRATIVDQCTAVLRLAEDGQTWVPVSQGGQVLSLRDPRLHTLLGVQGADASVHKLLPVFSQLATVGQGIARAAGQDDLIDPFDLS